MANVLPSLTDLTWICDVDPGEEVFSYVLEKAKASCPRASEAPPRPPDSWSAALAMAQQREEEKRKRDVKKDKSKASKATQQAGDLPGSNAAPGSLIGHLPDQSVFWLFMEVRRVHVPHRNRLHDLPRFADRAVDL